MDEYEVSAKTKVTTGVIQFISTMIFIGYCFALYNGDDNRNGVLGSLFLFVCLSPVFFPKLPLPEKLFKNKNTTGSRALDIWVKLNSILTLVVATFIIIDVIIPLFK